MIREQSGDLLSADVEALVNAVNAVGVIGKGIALQFKQTYPEMFREYARAARAGEVQIGAMHVRATGATSDPRFIISFPTKRHWRSPSAWPTWPRAYRPLPRPSSGMTSGRWPSRRSAAGMLASNGWAWSC